MGLESSDWLKNANCMGRIRAYYAKDRLFCILLFFFIAVLIIGYLIPLFSFGRPFGTDTYTHIFHAQEMYGTDSLFDFYDELGKKVLNPALEDNMFNYPFGSWLLIAVLAKVINSDPILTALIFSTLFLGIVAISYFIFTGLFLRTKSQKMFALLLLFSMPNFVITVNNYRPSTFIVPFLLFAIYATYSDEIDFKSLSLMSLCVFVIALTHTGTLIYLMIFSILFFWMYCLFARKLSRPLFLLSSSTFLFFWIAVKLFPHLYKQYATKSVLFLTPGNFLSNKLHIFFADDLSRVLYENLFINHQFVYVIIWAAFIFAVGSLLVFVGNYIFQHYSQLKDDRKYAIIPVSGISHSFLTTPFWIGPMHTLLAVIGFFRLDLKGKCLAITVLLTTVAPAMMQASEGMTGATGALREISYLFLIIPIAAVLGLWYITPIIKDKIKHSRALITILYVIIFTVIIVTPVVGNGYYLPSISGDDYIIEGMQWLSGTGSPNEKVAGYGYRTVPVYTGKIDASYGLAYGTQTRSFIQLLKGIYFKKNGNQVMDFYSQFGAKYILISDKLVANLNTDNEEVMIDSQLYLDKIYSSRDFGIFASLQQSNNPANPNSKDNQISIEDIGSNIEIKTKIYKVILDQKTPTIKYLGTPSLNYLQEGAMYEMARISWLGNSDDLGTFTFFDEDFTREEHENQLIYHTVLSTTHGTNPWSSVTVIYTFLPETIKREFIISNDQRFTTDSPIMRAYFSTNLFMPASKFVLKKSFKRVEKDIYPSDDSVDINDVYEEFYFSNGDSGIYIKYDETAPYPQYISYKGSTVYDYSSFNVANFEMVQPGASLSITQSISVGTEDLAKQHILNENRISLHPYPDGITPLILGSYRSGSEERYGKTDTFAIGENNIEYTDVTGVLRPKNTLDTILNDGKRKVPYILSISVSPPNNNILNMEGLRKPQMAMYQGEPTGTVILPVSEPRTDMLGSRKTYQEFFNDWENVIRSVTVNDDMAFFLTRPEDVENPKYSEGFLDIFSYAEDSGLTLTKPGTIANHFTNLQQVTFTSQFEIDEATIVVKNNNNFPVNGVTFVLQMPVLDRDVYVVTNNGEIKKTIKHIDQNIVYVAVDLESQDSKTIIIRPSLAKKQLSVEIPGSLKEGNIMIVVRDEMSQPINKARIIIDDMPYTTNEYGNVSVYLRRGAYELSVEKAGYRKEIRNISVNSYLSFFEELF